MDQLDALPFVALAKVVEWRRCEFSTQELVNTAWALATTKQPDEELLTGLVRAAERRVSE